MVHETVQRLGGLTILVNNCGTNIRKLIDDVGWQEWDALLDLNLKSYFFAARQARREMINAGHGKVINISSLMAWSVFRHPNGLTYGPYAASKGGVVSLTRALAVEWAMDNIQVNCICPTFIDTPLTRVLTHDPMTLSAIIDRAPNARLGQVEELVGPCVFLASGASNLVSGTSMLVDGAWHAS
jgi:NAD(P)-dependent dehydrogenase (short-subunit alcohol dehydrogenase family)